MADSPPSIAVVIPAFHAALRLPATVAALRREYLGDEIAVAAVDSDAATARAAKELGARTAIAPKGRGPQLIAGAEATTAPWLLFLHADTCLGLGAGDAARAFAADPRNAERAAAFRLGLDDPSFAARRIEKLANFRARAFALPYGDQGLLISRAFYRALGGYRPLALMEDVDIVRRIGRARLAHLKAVAVTSADRYRRDGWWARPVRNLCCLSLWLAGVAPEKIAGLYER